MLLPVVLCVAFVISCFFPVSTLHFAFLDSLFVFLEWQVFTRRSDMMRELDLMVTRWLCMTVPDLFPRLHL